MNIKELKEAIKDLPDDMLVYVSDSEYGPEESNTANVEDHWDWVNSARVRIRVLTIK